MAVEFGAIPGNTWHMGVCCDFVRSGLGQILSGLGVMYRCAQSVLRVETGFRELATPTASLEHLVERIVFPLKDADSFQGGCWAGAPSSACIALHP